MFEYRYSTFLVQVLQYCEITDFFKLLLINGNGYALTADRMCCNTNISG